MIKIQGLIILNNKKWKIKGKKINHKKKGTKEKISSGNTDINLWIKNYYRNKTNNFQTYQKSQKIWKSCLNIQLEEPNNLMNPCIIKKNK